jgi:hypothetical protein
MPKPVTEPSGWLFLALADAASVPSRGPEQLTSSVKIIFERIESAPSIRAMAAKRSSKLSIRRRLIVEIELTFLGQLRFFWASRQTREKNASATSCFAAIPGDACGDAGHGINSNVDVGIGLVILKSIHFIAFSFLGVGRIF